MTKLSFVKTASFALFILAPTTVYANTAPIKVAPPATLSTTDLNNESFEQAQSSNNLLKNRFLAHASQKHYSSSDAVIADGTGVNTPPIAVTPALPENFYGHKKSP